MTSLKTPNQPHAHATEQREDASHTAVAPSFIVRALRGPLEYRTGPIAPGELLGWARPFALPESAKPGLRDNIVRRMRPRAQWLWVQPTGVRLCEGWQTVLQPDDIDAIEKVLTLHPERPFETLTLDDLRQGFHKKLAHMLAVLARIEAIYWIPPHRPTMRSRAVVSPQPEAPFPKGEVRPLLERVLAIPWISNVSPQDLRFGFPGAGTLPDWLTAQMRGSSVPASVVELLKKLDAAQNLTAFDEARALIAAAGKECIPQSSPGATDRWVDIFMARHFSVRRAGKTLATVGVEFNLTRERVRQIAEAFEAVFRRSPAISPSLDRALEAVARIAPCDVEEANEQLGRFLGDGAGVESLISWAAIIGNSATGLRTHRVRRRLRGNLVDVTLVEHTQTLSWLRPLINHVSRDTLMFGCTNVLRIAGHLAISEEVAPGRESIESALEGNEHFRWLDKETGWFTLGDSAGSSIANRVRKIMAVAQTHVGADEIAGALAGDDLMMYRYSRVLGLSVPPVHVLRELFSTWPWLKVVQRGRFMAGPSFDAKGVLSDAEALAANIIGQHDGVACRFELRDGIMNSLHLTNMAVSVMLGSSPIFVRLEHGLYSLIGRRIGDTAVNAARARYRLRAAQSVRSPEIGEVRQQSSSLE